MQRRGELKAEMRKLIDLLDLDVREEIKDELTDQFVQTLYEWLNAPPEDRGKLLDRKGKEIVEWFDKHAVRLASDDNPC